MLEPEDLKTLLEVVQRTEVVVARIEERQLAVVDKLAISSKWQVDHDAKDDKRFVDINNYGRSIAIVASFFGAGVTLGLEAAYEWAKGKLNG